MVPEEQTGARAGSPVGLGFHVVTQPRVAGGPGAEERFESREVGGTNGEGAERQSACSQQSVSRQEGRLPEHEKIVRVLRDDVPPIPTGAHTESPGDVAQVVRGNPDLLAVLPGGAEVRARDPVRPCEQRHRAHAVPVGAAGVRGGAIRGQLDIGIDPGFRECRQHQASIAPREAQNVGGVGAEARIDRPCRRKQRRSIRAIASPKRDEPQEEQGRSRDLGLRLRVEQQRSCALIIAELILADSFQQRGRRIGSR